MYGLAAIQQANGWAMAGAGACIVITGLAVLAFLISMIPRLTGLFEPKPVPPKETTPKEAPPTFAVPERLPDDPQLAAEIYIRMTEALGPSFSLVDLHRKSKEVGLPHPHLSINRFREAGILVSSGEGLFSWQPTSDNA